MNEKYLAFSPYRSGLGNVIMSYECALALSYITGRKLFLPPTIHLTHIKTDSKVTNHNLWDIFDKDITKEEFELENYCTHKNFKDKFEKIQTTYSWFKNLPSTIKDCYNWETDPTKNTYRVTGSDICFVHNKQLYKDTEDFKSFVLNRNIIDVDVSEQYLLFENNLFQNYWYLIYPGGPSERNLLKNKVNKVTRYKQKFYDMFESSFISKILSYNAVHIRRNDFFVQFGYTLRNVDQSDKLLTQLLRVFDQNKPLYIATDECDLSFFEPVKQIYKEIFFLQDIKGDYSLLDRAILDQIICSRAADFYGTKNSTFSRRINVMRGLEGRIARDNTGINVLDLVEAEDDPFPWTKTYNGEWSWASSAYLQWTQEHVS